LNRTQPASFDLAIFDYDGVLVDSLEEALSVGCEYCRSVNHDRLPTEAIIGSLEKMTYFDLARAIGLSEKGAERYSLYTFDRFRTMGSAMAFFPEIEMLLRNMATRDVAIVSGNDREVISAKLFFHSLKDTIPCILGALEPGDKTEKIGQACRFFGVAPGRACMIGDSTSDIRHARQAGVRSIAVTWGWQSREKLVGENPDFVVDNVRDLAALLNAGDLLSTTHR
jgi:phosphoglycolate phosphatase